MAAICYSDFILMKFYLHITYMLKIPYSKFANNILTNNKIQPIFCMAPMRYIGHIRLLPTCIQRATSICGKFHQDNFETQRLVWVATRGHTDIRTLG